MPTSRRPLSFVCCLSLAIAVLTLSGPSHGFEVDWRFHTGLITQDTDVNGNKRLPPELDPEQRRIRFADDTAGLFSVYIDPIPLVAIGFEATTMFQHKIELSGETVGNFQQYNFSVMGRLYPVRHLAPYIDPFLAIGGYFAQISQPKLRLGQDDFELKDDYNLKIGIGLDANWGSRVYITTAIHYLKAQTRIRIKANGEFFSIPLEYDPFTYELAVGYRF